MNRRIKKAIICIAILIVGIQLYQPTLNKSSKRPDKNDFVWSNKLPANMNAAIATSCYDCHSDNTNYRWYDYVQPIRIWVDNHINNGKKELNFSEWNNYSIRHRKRLLASIKEQISTGQMPLRSYLFIHKEANLTPQQRHQWVEWIDAQSL